MNEPSALQIILVCVAFLGACFGIAALARRHSRPDTADKIRADQLRAAEVARLEWLKQSEHAQAMATMYARQAKRLAGESKHV